jgi:hypothetical protein
MFVQYSLNMKALELNGSRHWRWCIHQWIDGNEDASLRLYAKHDCCNQGSRVNSDIENTFQFAAILDLESLLVVRAPSYDVGISVERICKNPVPVASRSLKNCVEWSPVSLARIDNTTAAHFQGHGDEPKERLLTSTTDRISAPPKSLASPDCRLRCTHIVNLIRDASTTPVPEWLRCSSRIDEILGIIRLDGQREVPAARLSHGQKQWLAIARELAYDVFVMDRGEIVVEGLMANLIHKEIGRHLTV